MKNSIPRTTPTGELAISAYLHAKANAAGVPLAGTFELTPRCNFSCRMCYVHENVDPRLELSAEDWIALGKTARDAGMLFLLLTGGEPFLRKDFPEIYHNLRNLGLMISINTNGSLLTDELLELFSKEPPTRINVTLYGGSGETYLDLCRNDAFETVKTNILRLIQAKIPVKINCSITPYNARDIVAIHDFAKEHGIPVQSTTYMYPPVRVNGCQYGEAPDRFAAEEAARYMLLCREQLLTPEQLASSAFYPEDDLCPRDMGEPMSCRAGRTTFWVTWNGGMLPCGTFPTQGSHDIRSLGFSQAWQLVREDTKKLFLPPECAGCGLKNRCMACAAACLAETGSTSTKPDYICRLVHRLHELTAEKYPLKGDHHETQS